MIRFWLSRNAAIPIYEQLTSQFILGILSRRIAPGEKLPSVRELARRLKIHPNTVSAVYRTLGGEGWVDQRRGSGVFVRPQRSLPFAGQVLIHTSGRVSSKALRADIPLRSSDAPSVNAEVRRRRTSLFSILISN